MPHLPPSHALPAPQLALPPQHHYTPHNNHYVPHGNWRITKPHSSTGTPLRNPYPLGKYPLPLSYPGHHSQCPLQRSLPPREYHYPSISDYRPLSSAHLPRALYTYYPQLPIPPQQQLPLNPSRLSNPNPLTHYPLQYPPPPGLTLRAGQSRTDGPAPSPPVILANIPAPAPRSPTCSLTGLLPVVLPRHLFRLPHYPLKQHYPLAARDPLKSSTNPLVPHPSRPLPLSSTTPSAATPPQITTPSYPYPLRRTTPSDPSPPYPYPLTGTLTPAQQLPSSRHPQRTPQHNYPFLVPLPLNPNPQHTPRAIPHIINPHTPTPLKHATNPL
nr:extensin-like [Salvelinus alpinus]